MKRGAKQYMPNQSMPKDIRVLNVRLPDEVIKWIDTLVDAGVYNSRSEALRDFIREQIIDNHGGKSD